MVWGEPHPAAVHVGTTGEIEQAAAALASVGVRAPTLAAAAIEAADVIRAYRDAVTRHVRQEDTGAGAPRPEGGFVP